MKPIRSALSALGAVALLGAFAAPVFAAPALIPQPAEMRVGEGAFAVRSGTQVLVPPGDDEALFAGRRLADLARQLTGVVLAVTPADKAAPGPAIVLVRDPGAPVAQAEGYALDVAPDQIRIRARDEAGLFYGAMTLVQLLGADGGGSVQVSALTIHDWPRFSWRGLMLDSARHYQPPATIKALIDAMAEHKLNTFHWHLTDDQGWRLEIKRYPDLTRIGAWRTPPGPGGQGHDAPYGGYYTQDEVRNLVAYAAARHVTIVPEIDMPGHAQAAVAAEPEIGVTGAQPKVAVDWGVNPYLYNVDDKSLTFVRNVLDEVMALFPSTFVHVGGDEALKDQWQASPQVQAKMRSLGVADENALQSWFIEQVGQYLGAHGRRLIGWDEILEGGVPPSASVMSWRGLQGAIDAAKLNHDVVLSPAPTLYLDNLQSRRSDEPAGRLAVVSLADVYGFDPMPKALDASQASHVLGAQANVWTEYLAAPWQVTHAVFPRIDALSEVVWSPADKRDWSGFLARLPSQLARYRRLGIDSADSAFAVDFELADGRNAALASGRGRLSLSNQAGFGQIRYTTNGAMPTLASPLYEQPLALALGTAVTATAFTSDGQPLAAPRAYHLDGASLRTRDSGALQPCPEGDMGLRVPMTPDATSAGPVFNVNLFDSCWVYPKARLDGIGSIQVSAARLPRNYGLAHDQSKVVAHPARSRFGELVVRADRCNGPVLASLPLPDPASSPNRLDLGAALARRRGEHDLCMTFTAPIQGPLYAIDWVRLSPKSPK